MASSTYCLCSSNIVNGAPAASRDLSSSAAFASASPLTCCPPTPRSFLKLHTTKCSLSEEDQPTMSVAKRAFVGVVATGAALAVFTNMAMAAQGPGNEGARRVAEKADKLLQAADKLNIEDAPPRFGPGRPGGAKDPTKISQQAGGGAVSAAKGTANDASKGVSDAAKKVQNKSGGFFGFGKNTGEDIASQAKGKADEVVGRVKQVVTRDGLGRVRVPKDIASNVQGAVGQAQSKQSEIANSAKDAIGQAQSKANVGSSGGNVLSSLQEGLQGLKEGAVQSGEDAKNTVQKGFQ